MFSFKKVVLSMVLCLIVLGGCNPNQIAMSEETTIKEENNQEEKTNVVDEKEKEILDIYNSIFKMDTHLHLDVPMEKDNMPWTEYIDLREAMKKTGMNAIGATFAVDYVKLKYEGHALERFNNALDEIDRILAYNNIERALNYEDVIKKYNAGEPVVIQEVEGGHFLEGDVSRIDDAYNRGLRIFCLLHDNDATPPLGDVYTNEPAFGGLTTLGADTIKECERLGILVDLAHCDDTTVKMALEVATKPLVISHTGPKPDVEPTDGMAKMMTARLIKKDIAKLVADKGGVVGIWPHLANSPEEYAKNIKIMVDAIGIDHVCIGTDSKITTEFSEWEDWGNDNKIEKKHDDEKKKDEGDKPAGFGKKDPNAINHVWNDVNENFYMSVVRALYNEGFNKEEIAKITGENFLRVFKTTTK